MAARIRPMQAQSCPVRALQSRHRHRAALPVLLVHLRQRHHMLNLVQKLVESRASPAEQPQQLVHHLRHMEAPDSRYRSTGTLSFHAYRGVRAGQGA